MNVCTFTGNLGKDCRTANVGGTSVCNFTVAARSGYGDKEQTLWLDCALWGNRGAALAQYLTKGQQVAVSGEIGTREHEGKTYLTLRVAEVTLVGGKQGGQSEPQRKPEPQPELEDSIPF